MDSAEWAANLQCIIHRYIARNYRECASRCTEMLAMPEIHPTHTAFLHFYAGLSYELIAQPQHKFSLSKLDNLRLADTHYREAATILPVPSSTPGAAGIGNVNDQDWELEFTSRSSRQSVSSALSDNPPALSTTNGESPTTDRGMLQNAWMRTTAAFSGPVAMYMQSMEAEARTAAMVRYASHLGDLSQLLQSHIRWIATLLQESEEAQAKRRDNYVYGDVEEEERKKAEERMARIREGRARGWVRERFDRGRIDRLIKKALDEL